MEIWEKPRFEKGNSIKVKKIDPDEQKLLVKVIRPDKDLFTRHPLRVHRCGPHCHNAIARGGNPETARDLLSRIQVKLSEWNLAFVRPPVRTMNHLGLIYAGLHPAISGIILGVRSTAQLQETLDF